MKKFIFFSTLKNLFIRFLKLFENHPKIGDVFINPKWRWTIVENPDGQKNGNGFNKFGSSVGIKEKGKLTVVALDKEDALVVYESPDIQGFGSEAGNGTLFLIPQKALLKFPTTPEILMEKEQERKERIIKILKKSLAKTI